MYVWAASGSATKYSEFFGILSCINRAVSSFVCIIVSGANLRTNASAPFSILPHSQISSTPLRRYGSRSSVSILLFCSNFMSGAKASACSFLISRILAIKSSCSLRFASLFSLLFLLKIDNHESRKVKSRANGKAVHAYVFPLHSIKSVAYTIANMVPASNTSVKRIDHFEK